MSRTDVPGLAETAVATDPAQALAAAIDRIYPALRKTVEVLVLKAGLGRNADEVAETAGEVLAEAVARAMERADQWRLETSPRPWLARFAAYVILERQHKLKQDRERFPAAVNALDADGDPLDAVIDPTTIATDRLFELFDLVAEPARTLLRRAYLDDEPQAEIALSLGITAGALRVRLLRAKERFTDAYRAAQRGEKGGRR